MSVLEDRIGCRRWRVRTAPFPHVVAADVFVPAFYDELDAAFRGEVARGLSEVADTSRLSRIVHGYDAYTRTLAPEERGPLDVFQSRAWHDLLARLTGVAATRDVDAALHHHVRGSVSGAVHNDLNPGFFVDMPRPDGINPARRAECSYTHGTTRDPTRSARETVRAVAMLYYLANPPWNPGDGGETGLFEGPTAGLDEATRIAPRNNTLLVFECTPRSYHAFLHNPGSSRSSVIAWLHRAKEEAVARWGRAAIPPWR